MNLLITGATGLLGRRLALRVPSTIALTRNPDGARRKLPDSAIVLWDPTNEVPPASALRDVDAVVHLAGESVATRWTEDKRRRIRESRVVGTRNLMSALRSMESPPSVFVSASAVGFYGNRGDAPLDEESRAGKGFLADVCREWEAEAIAAEEIGMRVVRARFGLVLAPEGGAYPRLRKVFRAGLGGRFGSGRQWSPWVHVDDAVGMILHAVSNPALSGAMNVVAPEAVRNADFVRAVSRAVSRPALLPLPAPLVSVVAGEMSELFICSQRVAPAIALRTGYEFLHPSLDRALADVEAGRAT